MCFRMVRPTCLRILSTSTWQKATAIGELQTTLNLNSHGNTTVIRHSPRTTFALSPSILERRVVGIVERRKILSMFDDKWRFSMAVSTHFVWIDTIAGVVLLLLLKG